MHKILIPILLFCFSYEARASYLPKGTAGLWNLVASKSCTFPTPALSVTFVDISLMDDLKKHPENRSSTRWEEFLQLRKTNTWSPNGVEKKDDQKISFEYHDWDQMDRPSESKKINESNGIIYFDASKKVLRMQDSRYGNCFFTENMAFKNYLRQMPKSTEADMLEVVKAAVTGQSYFGDLEDTNLLNPLLEKFFSENPVSENFILSLALDKSDSWGTFQYIKVSSLPFQVQKKWAQVAYCADSDVLDDSTVRGLLNKVINGVEDDLGKLTSVFPPETDISKYCGTRGPNKEASGYIFGSLITGMRESNSGMGFSDKAAEERSKRISETVKKLIDMHPLNPLYFGLNPHNAYLTAVSRSISAENLMLRLAQNGFVLDKDDDGGASFAITYFNNSFLDVGTVVETPKVTEMFEKMKVFGFDFGNQKSVENGVLWRATNLGRYNLVGGLVRRGANPNIQYKGKNTAMIVIEGPDCRTFSCQFYKIEPSQTLSMLKHLKANGLDIRAKINGDKSYCENYKAEYDKYESTKGYPRLPFKLNTKAFNEIFECGWTVK